MLQGSTSREASSAMLPYLPQEVLDLIILSSFDIARLHDPEIPNCAPVVKNIFASPFFRVNRACRQSGIDRLADSFLWIEVASDENGDSPEMNESLRLGVDSLFHQIPLLDERSVNLLPGKRTSVLLELNRCLGTAVDETGLQPITHRYIFPYQYESLLRFIVEWRRLWQRTFISIHVTCNDRTALGLVGDMVSQTTELVQFLRYGPLSQTTFGPSSDDSTSLLGENVERSGASALEDCQSVLAHVKQLDSLGMVHEADIFAHQYFPVLHHHVSGLLWGQRTAFIEDLTRPGWMEKQQSKNHVLIQQQYLLCNLVAIRARQRIWTNPCLRQRWIYPEQEIQPGRHWRPAWDQEPAFGFFGVPDRWMAAWHYHTGLACANIAFALPKSVRPEDFSSVVKPELSPGRRAALEKAIDYLWCAMELDPNNQRYQYFYGRLKKLVEEVYKDIFPRTPVSAFRRRFTDVDGMKRYWIGTLGMSLGLGNNAITFLPRAQRLAVQDLTTLDEIMEFQNAKGIGYADWSPPES